MRDRLLLVDDDESVVRALSRHVSREYEVHVACSGKMALELMEQHSFAVVVSDNRMPGMTGAEFIDQARCRWPETQYLMLTGNQETEAERIGGDLPEGVRRVLRKPCSISDLLAEIEQGCKAFAALQTTHGEPAPEVARLTERC